MRRLWLIVFTLPLFAQVIPGRYIVELSGEPAAAVAARQPRQLRQSAMATRRSELRGTQQRVRGRVEALQAEVLGSVDTVANALLVRIPDSAAQRLVAIPGVVRVSPVWEGRLFLDRAVSIHRITAAWNTLPAPELAGAGVKIGIIDSGIDPDHPGFQDASLQMPEGYPLPKEKTPDGFVGKNKIIVARSYESYYPGSTDSGPRDRNGHGTGVAMVAAGEFHTAPLASISGAAPKAWLGVYRVSSGTAGSFSTDVILKALDDAVADGMDILNLSLGIAAPLRAWADPLFDAVERASAAGVIVVAAAGNEGPLPNSMSSPATAPSVVAVGATSNDRLFATDVQVVDGPKYVSFPGSGPWPAQSISGPLFDVASLDPTGFACDPLPPGSLRGQVALILRGVCLFSDKLKTAAAAGAIAAIIYTDAQRPDLLRFSTGDATLPVQSLSYADGVDLKARLQQATGLTVALQPGPESIVLDPNKLAAFSSNGPNPDDGIKPDLTAVGEYLYTAAQTLDKNGESFDPSGYLSQDGTSFSSPIVAGAFAVLKSARPGLTAAQYRSLIINTAAPILFGDRPAPVQRVGTGKLDLAAALDSQAAAQPTSLSFGVGGETVGVTRQLSITNLSVSNGVFALAAEPRDGKNGPVLSTNTLSLGAGASGKVEVSFSLVGATAGEYDGFVVVRNTQSGVPLRIPYWYAVASNTPANVRVLDSTDSGRPGAVLRSAVFFQITDASGIGLPSASPKITATQGGGRASRLISYDEEAPGAFMADITLGPLAGDNTFRIDAGAASATFTIRGVSETQP